MCCQNDEVVSHILSECSKMAQREYKCRHGWVGKKVYWEVSKQCRVDVKGNLSHMQSATTMISTFYGILKYKLTMRLRREGLT